MPTQLTVTGAQMLTPGLRRVHFRSDDLSAFRDSVHTDRYVKLVFLKPGVTYPQPLHLKALRDQLPPEDMPVVRTYAALFPDHDAGTVSIDFVVHGDQGVAGPWAAAAQPGDQLLANGPGGAYAPDPTADWHLLVGDETALPAITAALQALPADAVAHVVVEVEGAGYQLDLPLPAGATLHWVHRDTGGSVQDVVRGLDWLPGRVHVFAHGEAQQMMHGLRPYLLRERGVPRDLLSISGYWRQGRTEESFREWKAELARQEEGAV
ncbi:siderophore-interacting protein [Nakamurella flavida]|uniref:Siderophore-interacting protein n=1 Tax=Nakamurella flavida TaxID=363630 RepID=A0A938YNA8_9ACTN|nr:siderophore-interacting protein [Nakamurella flavida]MBM9476198.1 siderophore-interacting protein [Nakamurella flavida]MDP9777057.1 NADPH-dependent ferric siderophore reductase [Nakamurella flavida]